MQNSLQLHGTLMSQLRKWLPDERITRRRNLAWLMTGLFLARSVHLSHIAHKLPLQGQVVSLTNRMRRFLDNPRVNVWRYYQPIARQLLTGFGAQRLTLLIDCTALGFNYQLMVVAIAYRRRALPLIWSIHRGKRGMVETQPQIALLRKLASDSSENRGLDCGRRWIWPCGADALAQPASLALLFAGEQCISLLQTRNRLGGRRYHPGERGADTLSGLGAVDQIGKLRLGSVGGSLGMRRRETLVLGH